MDQKIEAPDACDIDRIARQLILADSIAKEVTGRAFDGSRNDLALIQQILDSKIVERDATYTLQALGVAFGKALSSNTLVTTGGSSKMSMAEIQLSALEALRC